MWHLQVSHITQIALDIYLWGLEIQRSQWKSGSLFLLLSGKMVEDREKQIKRTATWKRSRLWSWLWLHVSTFTFFFHFFLFAFLLFILINYLIGKPQCTCLRTLIYLTMAPGVIFYPLKGRQFFSISASLTFIWAPLPFIIIIQGSRRGIFLVKGIPRNKEKGLKSARLSKCRWIPKYFERQK